MAEAADSGAVEEAAFTPVANRGVITACVVLAVFLQTLDQTIANVALPHMQGSLSATQEETGWVLTSYMIAVAIMIPLSGWLARTFGRRPIFLISTLAFTTASALCGLAVSLPQIVLFRFLQGLGGAALVPMSQATLFDVNHPRDFTRAMAIWAAGANLGPILGPLLGGWLTDAYSWRWVFFINVPLGGIAFFGLLLTLPDTKRVAASQFDFLGFATMGLGVGALQLFLDRGQVLDWFGSKEVVIYATVAVASFYLFGVQMLTARRPFLNLILFKDGNYVIACALIFILGGVLLATLALTPPLLQNELNYPALLAGVVMTPRGVGAVAAMMVLARARKVDLRAVIVIGLLLNSWALWRMSHFTLVMGQAPIVAAALVQGFGFGLAYSPAVTLAFTTLGGELRNEGAAFFNLMRNVGSSIGISVMMFLWTQNTQRMHAVLAADVTPYVAGAHPPLGGGAIDAGSAPSLAALNALITRQAAMIGYLDDFRLIMALTLLTIPLVLMIRPAARGA